MPNVRNPSSLPIAALVFALLAAALLALPATATAQVEGKRVEFTVVVGDDHADDDASPDVRQRTQREVTAEAARRIERRFDAVGIRGYRVEPINNRHIKITVYGNHSPSIIKSMVIPDGRLEVRPVLLDGAAWIKVAADLPSGIELRPQPGSFRTDHLFLFAHSASTLRQALSDWAPAGERFELYPFEEGWRALHLGAPVATERDVMEVSLEQTPSGIPYVAATFTADAAQQIRAAATDQDLRHLAILLDGEVVALHRFSRGRFSETLEIDPPNHLRSTNARRHWAFQVGGRLAAPIPVRLAEFQE